MITMQMGKKDLVHLAHLDAQGVVLGNDSRSAVKNKLVPAANLDINAAALLRQPGDA